MSPLDDETRTGRPLLAPACTDSGNRGAQIAQRRAEVFRLRMAGLPFRAIASELGISPSLAHDDMEAIYRQMLPVSDAEQLRAKDADTLERLEALGLERLAKRGWDGAVVDRVLAIQHRRAKLLGLDAPAQVQHSGEVVVETATDRALRELVEQMRPDTVDACADLD